MNRASYLLILCTLFLSVPASLQGAGAILVDTDVNGDPVLWKDGIIHFNMESGPQGTLGTLTNAEATALVRELFEDWKVTINGIETTDLIFDEGEDLGGVDLSNFNDHFTYCPPSKSCPTEAPPFVVGSARTGETPILFDDDGSMVDAVLGTGARLNTLGFAGPRVVERSGEILYITEGQAMLNGLFIDGIASGSNPEVASLDDFKGAIFHELGHLMGIDHTQVNLSSVIKYINDDFSEQEAIPTMLPLFINGTEQLSPHFDDKVAVSFLYPSSAFNLSFCRMEGKVFEEDGQTELQGVNVIAANADDPLMEATSFVSGAFYVGNFSNCESRTGDFLIAGLTPGTSYGLSIEQISQSFTGGSSIEPCDPPQSGFSLETLPGLFSCSSAGEVITAGSEATTEIVTTKTSTVPGDGDGGSGDSGAGGCSLIPDHLLL